MQNDHSRHFPTAAPAHYIPPLWATEGADRALKRHRSRQTSRHDLTKARHFHSDTHGTFVEGARPCRADEFCRGRCCKPPMSEVRALRRLQVALLIWAIVAAAVMLACAQ
jgi:hypothetical protein